MEIEITESNVAQELPQTHSRTVEGLHPEGHAEHFNYDTLSKNGIINSIHFINFKVNYEELLTFRFITINYTLIVIKF